MISPPHPWLDPHGLPEDMALGRRWGLLRIVGYEQRQERYCRRTYVICVCLCGAIHTTRPANLRAAGNTLSCGCYRRAANRARCHQLWQAVRAGRRTVAVGRPKTLERKAA